MTEYISSDSNALKLVTEENAKEALLNDKGPDADFVSYDVLDFTSKSDTVFGRVTSVTVTYTLSGERKTVTYVVKLHPSLQTFKILNHKMFVKEAGFYTKFLPDLNAVLEKLEQPALRVPKCYFVGLELEKEIIYFEDMRVGGYKLFDMLKNMDEAHTSLVLNELARLHAASALLQESLGAGISLEEKYEIFGEIYDATDPQGEEEYKRLMATQIATVAELVSKTEGYENVTKALEEIAPKTLEKLHTLTQSEPQFTVACHGDCWSNNILFRYDENGAPKEVCFLDFQITRIGSIAVDLNLLLQICQDGLNRKQNLDSYLQEYYSSYEKIFSTAQKDAMRFTLEQLKVEYCEKKLYGFLIATMRLLAIIVSGTDMSTPSDINKENMEQIFAEYKANVFEQTMKSSLFRPRLTDLIDEMVQAGVFQ